MTETTPAPATPRTSGDRLPAALEGAFAALRARAEKVRIASATSAMRRTVRRASGDAGQVQGVVEYVGARCSRVVLVGPDGFVGDQVLVGTLEQARAAAASAGVTVVESFDRELVGRMHITPGQRRRMAGIQLGSYR